MESAKNIFICLVHENQDCIIDLVRNLKYLDPQSKIILYNGGTDSDLFLHFPFERYDVAIHPSPKPLKWGWLHDFAIDCMEYAIANFEFDTITAVDSDQLACSRNYSDFITKTLHENPNLGMLGQRASRIGHDTTIDPAITAYLEKDIWMPLLENLPNGKEAFLYWTFWPSTVFTYKASVDLVALFRTNEQLKEILKVTKIWASEEILLPTLTVALGYTIAENPCSFDFVKFKSKYTEADIRKAIDTTNSFWIHPIDRKINDFNRVYIRNHFDNYTSPVRNLSTTPGLSIPEIFEKTKHIEGWLKYDEMELLIASCSEKLKTKESPVIVEIGSYCGKATGVMALTAKAVNSKTTIVAIDDFKGRLGAEDTRIDQYPPSFEKFQKTLDDLVINDSVKIIKNTPYLAYFGQPIDILVIDGLHDYASVARDFYHYEKNVCPDGLIIFHDYCAYFPGVMAFVDELTATAAYEIKNLSSSLITLKRNPNKKEEVKAPITKTVPKKRFRTKLPLVSCIMPTYNRSEFIAHAIHQFLQQDYPNKELIIIDDSEISVEESIPDLESIKYSYHKVKSDLGTKRNLACKKAKGEIIIHLDDDDFYASDWLRKQVSFLIEQELDVTGLSTPIFYDKKATTVWQYIYPEKEKPWVYGATLCYTKKLWRSNPFPIINSGEDNMFVWSNTVKKIRPHEETGSYIGQIHDNNTSPKSTKDVRWFKLKKEQAKEILNHHDLA